MNRTCATKIHAASRGIIRSLNSIAVYHCKNSFGLVLQLQQIDPAGVVSVVYSGDCRPSASLQKAGYNCDLLIHEATFDDSLQSDACGKKHCTTSEAMAVSSKMMAKHTILTHFSQRYPHAVQVSNSNNEESSSSTLSEPKSIQTKTQYQYAVAFDFLQVSFPSQIHCLPHITGRLVHCFTPLHSPPRAGAGSSAEIEKSSGT